MAPGFEPPATGYPTAMTTPETDEPDFAEEHSRPTVADEQANQPNTEPDESVPRDDAGGMEPE